jgi:hypothetical protein
MNELTLPSTYSYLSEQKDVVLECTFAGPSGQTETVMGLWNDGVATRNGDSFIDRDAYRLYPVYYAYLDSVVQCLNDSVLVAVIAPQWRYFGDTSLSHTEY